jgi:hypothetical protein
LVYLLGDVLELEFLSQSLAGSLGELVTSTQHRTGENHHLAAMFIIEAVLSLAGEDVGRDVGNILFDLVSSGVLRPNGGLRQLTPSATGANLWFSPMGSGRRPWV